jgi:hypothetical protein
MKTSQCLVPLAGVVLAATWLSGCSAVSLPPAKSYSVRAGGVIINAKSVKIHGNWAELETDDGPVWVNGAVIKPIN